MFLYLFSLFKRASLSTIFYLCGNGSDTPVPLGVEAAELPSARIPKTGRFINAFVC